MYTSLAVIAAKRVGLGGLDHEERGPLVLFGYSQSGGIESGTNEPRLIADNFYTQISTVQDQTTAFLVAFEEQGKTDKRSKLAKTLLDRMLSELQQVKAPTAGTEAAKATKLEAYKQDSDCPVAEPATKKRKESSVEAVPPSQAQHSIVGYFEQDSVQMLRPGLTGVDLCFNDTLGEQFQMHMGVSRLIVQPLLACKLLHEKVNLRVCTDEGLKAAAVFTNTVTNQRAKSKFKQDARLEVMIKGKKELTFPLFSMETNEAEESNRPSNSKGTRDVDAIVAAMVNWCFGDQKTYS